MKNGEIIEDVYLHNGEIFELKIARCKIEKYTPYFTPFADDIMRK